MNPLLDRKVITHQYITTESDLKEAVKDLELYKKIVRDKNKRPRFAFDLETFPDIDGIEDMTADEASKAAEVLGIDDYRPLKSFNTQSGYESVSRLFQLGLDPSIEDIQFLFDVRALGEDALSFHHKDSIENCLLIGHYLLYDTEYLVSQFNLFPEFLRCTCIGPQLWLAGDNIDLTNPEKGKGQRYALYACYQKFLDWSWFKSYTGRDINEYVDFKLENQKSNWGAKVLKPTQLEYAADDVKIIHYLYKAQMHYLERIVKDYNKPGLQDTYRLECQAIVPFAIMGVVGNDVDTDQLDKVQKTFEDQIEKAETELFKYEEFWKEEEITKGRGSKKVTYTERKPINLNGKPYSLMDKETKTRVKNKGQLLTSLARLGIDLPGTGKELIQEALFDPDSPYSDFQKEILTKVLAYKKAVYMLSKYAKNLKSDIHSDGRFHPRYFQIGGKTSDSGALDGGVDTQRTTASRPPVQTFPADEEVGKEVRKIIRAPEGKKLIVLDFNNQEVQIAYMLTKDPYLYKVFKEGRDQHSESAKNVLGLDYLPAKGTDERKVGKTAYLAHQYQQGVKRFIHKVYIETKCRRKLGWDEAKAIKDGMKVQYSGITRKINACNAKINKELEDYKSLRSFRNRRPIFVGFTELPYKFEDTGETFHYTRLRNWCLSLEQERLASKPVMDLRDDILGRDYGKWNDEKEVFETWCNEFNSRVSEIRREYFNFLIQPEGATMLKLAMRDVFNWFKKTFYDQGYTIYDIAIVLECHDEIVIECPEELAEQIAAKVSEIMTRIFRAIVKGLDETAVAKPTICDNWAEGK